MRVRALLLTLLAVAACASADTATISGRVVVEGSTFVPSRVALIYGRDDGSGESSQIDVHVADDGTFSTEQDRRRYHLTSLLDCGDGLDVDATEGDVRDLVLRCRHRP